MIRYKIGDTLTQTIHGTDHSTTKSYTITGIGYLRVDLKRHDDDTWAWIETSKLERRLNSKHDDWKIISVIPQITLDEDLFTL